MIGIVIIVLSEPFCYLVHQLIQVFLCVAYQNLPDRKTGSFNSENRHETENLSEHFPGQQKGTAQSMKYKNPIKVRFLK